MLGKILLKLYAIWTYLVWLIIMIILTPFVLVPHLFGRRFGNRFFRLLWLWAFLFAKLTFIRIKVEGEKNLDPSKTFIYVCNHNSFLDAIAVAYAIPGHFAPLGKIELGEMPILGWIFKAKLVLVDRSNPESRKKSTQKLIRTLKKERSSILIFPEGTMNRTDQILTPFYDGAFRIAIETKTPLVPMVILNSKNLMPPNSLQPKPGRMKIIFGSPWNVDHMTLLNVKDLKKSFHDQMKETIQGSKA